MVGSHYAAFVGSLGGDLQLIAPLFATVGQTTVGNIGSQHLGKFLQLVDNLTTRKQIKVTILARLQTEVSVKAVVLLTFLVAVNDDITSSRNLLVGQLPGFLFLVFVTNLVILQVDGCLCGVIQLHP